MKIAGMALFTASILFSSAFSGEKKMPVFVLAGQSNMVGVSAKTNFEKLPADMQEQANVMFVKFWEVKLTKPLKPKNRIGPEVSFGYEMAKAMKCRIGIIKIAYGGTSLARHWNPDPAKYDKKKGVGVNYKRLTAYVKRVKKTNPNIEIVGMLWMQGEADSRYHAKKMEDYRDGLEMLIAGCRKEFGTPEMPFICGRINPPNWKFQKQVRTAQETAGSTNYAWIDCDKLELGKDKLHFTLKGQLDMGRNYAAAMLKLMGKKDAGENK
jgi:Carbohydrate esterase, sialic acid-specific acetylesterase